MSLTHIEQYLLQHYAPDTDLGWMIDAGYRHAYLGHPLAPPVPTTGLCAATVGTDEHPTVDQESSTAPFPTCPTCWRRAVLIRTRREPPADTDEPHSGSPGGRHRTDKHPRPSTARPGTS